MEETFFEVLERTRAVDRLLFWIAVLSPPVIASLAALLRNRPIVTRKRHRWVLALLCGPAMLLLWKSYNAVVDHFGLDSVAGLLVNVAIFASAALVITGVRLLLRAVLDAPANPPPPLQSVPDPEFRPYKPTLSDNPETVPPRPPLKTDGDL